MEELLRFVWYSINEFCKDSDRWRLEFDDEMLKIIGDRYNFLQYLKDQGIGLDFDIHWDDGYPGMVGRKYLFGERKHDVFIPVLQYPADLSTSINYINKSLGEKERKGVFIDVIGGIISVTCNDWGEAMSVCDKVKNKLARNNDYAEGRIVVKCDKNNYKKVIINVLDNKIDTNELVKMVMNFRFGRGL